MKRGGVAALLTILFALAASAGVFLYVQNARQQARVETRTATVVVSTVDIPAGQNLDPLIDQGSFVTKDVPRQDLIKNVITDVYQLQGQRTAYPILAGEQISAARFVGDLQAEGGRYGLPTGMQAAAVTLEPQRAGGGQLQEGDVVEAYGTFSIPGSSNGQVTRVLVPDAEVLAVFRDVENATSNSTVILAVLPVEAERLIYAQESGRVWLTLLPPNEEGANVAPVRSRDVT